MPDPQHSLLGPDGTPLIKESRLIVIKYPRNIKINPQLIASVGQQTGCNVIVLPMDSEILMGELATKEMVSVHNACHAIGQLPFIHFTKPELNTICSSLNYVVKQINAKPGSAEELISNGITRVLSATR